MKKIKVMIVDDHSLIREGLTKLLSLENDIEVVAQASNGREAVEIALAVKPNIILMDINMPVKNGLDALKELVAMNCNSLIIVITIHGQQEYLIEALKLGAKGYVLKDAEVESILEAIRQVYSGKTFIPQNIVNKDLIGEISETLENTKNRYLETNLSKREIQVLFRIADGKNNKEIADELFISEKTVKNHVSSIFKKIKVSDRTQAAVYAFKNKIV